MRDVKTVTLEQLKNATKTKWSWIDRDMICKQSHSRNVIYMPYQKKKVDLFNMIFANLYSLPSLLCCVLQLTLMPQCKITFLHYLSFVLRICSNSCSLNKLTVY